MNVAEIMKFVLRGKYVFRKGEAVTSVSSFPQFFCLFPLIFLHLSHKIVQELVKVYRFGHVSYSKHCVVPVGYHSLLADDQILPVCTISTLIGGQRLATLPHYLNTLKTMDTIQCQWARCFIQVRTCMYSEFLDSQILYDTGVMLHSHLYSLQHSLFCQGLIFAIFSLKNPKCHRKNL